MVYEEDGVVMKQILGTKKQRFCSRIINKPVLVAFTINGSGGLPHHVAEVWVDKKNMYLVHLKDKWFRQIVFNGRVLARPARVWIKRQNSAEEQKNENTWIQNAIQLIAETQSNRGINGITSQEMFKESAKGVANGAG